MSPTSPRLTTAEWALLREGLARLTPERLAEIARNAAALARRPSPPVACPVYAERPVACRSYGFYVQHDKGLYCREIEARVDGRSRDSGTPSGRNGRQSARI